MKLYLAGFESGIFQGYLNSLEPMNILVSYFYMRNKKIPKSRDLLIDSGGYSARVQGVDIDINDYGLWLKKNNIKKFFNLDKLSLAETKKNQETLEEMNLSPIPVWHPQHGVEELQRLVNRYEYIAVGNITGGQVGNRDRRIRVINHLEQFKDTKFHLFGVTDRKIIESYPFIYSLDSTSWLSGGKYGGFYFFERDKLFFYTPDTFKRKFGKAVNKFNYNCTNYWSLSQWKKYADYLEERENV